MARSRRLRGLVALLAVAALLTLAAAASGRPHDEAPSLGPAPTGLPQTWIAGLHLSGHVFHPGDVVTVTAHVNADKCFVPDPPCVRGAEWSLGGGAGKIVSGCNPKVPHGTPTVVCRFKAVEAEGWQIAGANFPNPTGTSAVSQDFYVVVGKDKRVLDGTVTNSKSGAPVQNVKLSIKGASRYTATTNASGYYDAVLPKGSYTVAPEGGKNNHFLPSSKRVSLGDKATASFKLQEKPIEIEWTMPERTPEWKAGSTVYLTDPGQINPGSWPVEFVLKTATGTACAAGTTYTWQVDDKPATFTPTGRPCHFTSSFPAQGKYKVTLAVKEPDGVELDGKVTIAPRDFLVVGLGDSVGSGEGNPDAAGPTWEDANCHRSHWSFEAQAARKLEEKDPHTSVTLVHLACSGGSIEHGGVAPYTGFAGELVPSQIAQLASLVGSRKPDAVVVSMGANDIGFATIVSFCSNAQGYGDNTIPLGSTGLPREAEEPLRNDDCMNKVPPLAPWSQALPGQPTPENPANPFDDKSLTLTRFVRARLDRLNCANPGAIPPIGAQPACTKGGLYGALATALSPILGQADDRQSRVFITQYFDPTRGADGRVCAVTLGTAKTFWTGGGYIGTREGTWASAQVVQHGLNTEVPNAAARHGWKVVTGIMDGYRAGHGYCAGSGRWVDTLLDALASKDKEGVLHPNHAGHEFGAERVFSYLEKALYKDGKPVAPPK